MKFQQIRNATTKLEYGGTTFLVDPWLADTGAMGSFRQINNPDFSPMLDEQLDIPMPMCGLPMAADEVLKGVDAYIVTHVHPDHIDMGPDGTCGGPLCHDTPLWVQNEGDAAVMKVSGFTDVRLLSEQGTTVQGVKLTKIAGCHGTIEPCGPSCGVVLEAEGEPTVYLVGDTVWFDAVEQALRTYRPAVIVVNACAAYLKKNGRLIMNADDIELIRRVCPDAWIIASHMDTVAHAALTRYSLRLVLEAKGLDNVYIPDDGETYVFD